MSREEAAAKALEEELAKMHGWGKSRNASITAALAAADAYDAANGVHRVSLDEGTVERAARALWVADSDATLGFWGNLMDTERDYYRRTARLALAAAVKEDG